MITIEFKSFGTWRKAGRSTSLTEARTFVAQHAPMGRRWADSVRFVVDGRVLAYTDSCKEVAR
jgi:hypothetical protein